QTAIFPRALFQDFLAGGDPLHADAARQFFQLAFVDLALEVEQVTDQAARRADDDWAGDERAGRGVAGDDRANDTTGDEQQFGLAGSARRPLVSVFAQHAHFAEDLARLAHAEAGLLFTVRSKYPDRAGLDDEQTLGDLACSAHGVTERQQPRLRALGQALDLSARQRRKQVDGREELGERLGFLRFHWAAVLALAGFDDVVLCPGPQPLLAQQPPDLGGGIVVEPGRMLCVHPEDLENGPIPRCEGSQQIAGGGVEYLRLDV